MRRRLIESSRFDHAQQQALCVDDYWAFFRKCHTPRDEIIEGIRYSLRRYNEVSASQRPRTGFSSAIVSAPTTGMPTTSLLRFDVKDIAERIELLEDRYCLVLKANLDAGGNGHDFTPVQNMLMGIYQGRIHSLHHQLRIVFYRWRKFHQTSPQETVVQMRKALYGETSYANPGWTTRSPASCS